MPPLPPIPSQSHIPAPFTLGQPLTAPTAVFEFHPTLGFTEEYTDNFLLNTRGRQENFRSTGRAGFSLYINEPKTQGSIFTSLNASTDSTGPSTIHFFPTVSGNLQHTIDPRLRLTLTDSFTRTDEPAQADQFGLRLERRTFMSNDLSLTVDWLVGIITTQAYYRNSLFLSDRDTTSHVWGANASTPLGPLYSFRLGYEFSLSDTPQTSLGTNILGTSSFATTTTTSSQTKTTTGHLVLASLSHQLGNFGSVGLSSSYATQSRNDARIWNISLFTGYGLPTGLSVSSSVGFSRLSSNQGSDSSAVTTNTNASYRFVRAVISLNVSQDYRQTFIEGQDFGIVLTRSYGGTFSYALTPFISSSLFVTYSENDFTGNGNAKQTGAVNQLTAGATLAWQVLRWLSTSLNYTFTEHTGSAITSVTGSTGDHITENRVTLDLAASF